MSDSDTSESYYCDGDILHEEFDCPDENCDAFDTEGCDGEKNDESLNDPSSVRRALSDRVLLIDGQLLMEPVSGYGDHNLHRVLQEVVELTLSVVRYPLSVTHRKVEKEVTIIRRPYISLDKSKIHVGLSLCKSAFPRHGIYPQSNRMQADDKMSSAQVTNAAARAVEKAKQNSWQGNSYFHYFGDREKTSSVIKTVQAFFDSLYCLPKDGSSAVSSSLDKKSAHSELPPMMTLLSRRDNVLKILQQLKKDGLHIPEAYCSSTAGVNSANPFAFSDTSAFSECRPSFIVHAYEEVVGGNKFLNENASAPWCLFHRELKATCCSLETVNHLKNAFEEASTALRRAKAS